MQGKKQRKRYRRAGQGQRAPPTGAASTGQIVRSRSCDLGRSPSTVADRGGPQPHRGQGPGKGEGQGVPTTPCPRLLS